ncbi:ELWxxDGT repeat protein [Pyxidicoccus caerfyrddinensis]|uniref:ELWxxDGT repeat protein n=1 Tax=Pyxidicoccus caerfyrddinensis TaxID=2709663 RepID=UPI0013DB6865|nr:ELWxxDGT repeat protein [Pyxidicoccus caerfyrddinensis]
MKQRNTWLSLCGATALLAACGATEEAREGARAREAEVVLPSEAKPVADTTSGGEAAREHDCGCRPPAFVADLTPGLEGTDVRSFIDLDGTPIVNGYNGGINTLWRLERRGGCGRWEAVLIKTGFGGLPLVFGSAVIGRTLYFAADDGGYGRELWKTDGTAEGTVLVKDIRPGPVGSELLRFITVGRTLYFVADDGEHGFELWKSDGTRNGTRLVEDIYPGAGSGFPDFLTAVDSRTLFFTADDGTHGREPWRSDGTRAGTRLIEDVYPGAASSGSNVPLFYRLTGRQFLFVADDGSHGPELWTTDGTPGGTRLVEDIYPGPMGSGIGLLTLAVVDGLLYFGADDGEHGLELWKSDGTARGTRLVEDILPGPLGSAPFFLLPVGTDQVFFDANDGIHGREPWRGEDSSRHTLLLADVWPGVDSGVGPGVTADDKVYFFGRNPTYGHELWVTDGTRSGTHLVKDINPGPESAFPGDPNTPYAVGSGLVFNAFEPVHGDELWWTDGTPAGTRMADLYEGTANSYPYGFTRVGDQVFFTAEDGVHGREPWALPVACFPDVED